MGNNLATIIASIRLRRSKLVNVTHAFKQFGLWLVCAHILVGCISVSPAMPTFTPTIELPTLRPTATSMPTQISTPTIVTPAQSTQTGRDAATFIKETYPDYSVLTPGEKFIKTWDIKNIGTSTWNTNYVLVVDAVTQNDSLGSPKEIHFPQETPPGSTITLSVPLAAPTASGTYSVYWKLKNDRGESFGVDGDRVWVTIMVCESGKTCSPPASTLGGSTSASGISVSLTSFTHDAQSATVDFCMTVPNRYYTLDSPAPTLFIDQKPVPFLDGGSVPPWGCYYMKYQVGAAQTEQAQHITLSIDTSLRMSPPPGDPDAACQSARTNLVAQYPGLDFQCSFSMAGYFINLKLPSGMTKEKNQQIITDAIEGAIYGPWLLTIKP